MSKTVENIDVILTNYIKNQGAFDQEIKEMKGLGIQNRLLDKKMSRLGGTYIANAKKQRTLNVMSEEFGGTVNDVSKVMGVYGYKWDKTGNMVDKAGNKVKLTNKQFKDGQAKIAGFNSKMLTVMFTAMAVERALNGIVKSQWDLWGITEMNAAMWDIVMLPAMENIAPAIWAVQEAFMELPEPLQEVIGYGVLFTDWAAKIVAGFAMARLAFPEFGKWIDDLITKAGGLTGLGIKIAGVSMVIDGIIDGKNGKWDEAVTGILTGGGILLAKSAPGLAAGMIGISAAIVLGEMLAEKQIGWMDIATTAFGAEIAGKALFGASGIGIPFFLVFSGIKLAKEGFGNAVGLGSIGAVAGSVLGAAAGTAVAGPAGTIPGAYAGMALLGGAGAYAGYQKDKEQNNPSNLGNLPTNGQSTLNLPSYFQQNKNNNPFNMQSIRDGIVKPDGSVIKTAPEDYIFATKNPENLAGGSGQGVIVNNVYNITVSDKKEFEKILRDNNVKLTEDVRRLIKT